MSDHTPRECKVCGKYHCLAGCVTCEPDPPAVSKDLLTDEEILENPYITSIETTRFLACKETAEAQLAKVQPRIAELEGKIAELLRVIEIAHLSLDRANGELGNEKQLCIYCHANTYANQGIVHNQGNLIHN